MPRRRSTYIQLSLLERFRNGPPPRPAVVLVNLTLTALALDGLAWWLVFASWGAA